MLLERIFPGRERGCCLEVGAHDGITGSNTLFFERIGWKCVLVEPVPEMCERIRSFRTAIVADCAAGSETGETSFYVSEPVGSWSSLSPPASPPDGSAPEGNVFREIRVKVRTLDEILSEAGVSELDFVTIDVEGHELEVLKGFSIERFRPRIMIVEDNAGTAGNSVRELLEKAGYKAFFRTGVNDWYGRERDPVTSDESVGKMKKLLGRFEFRDRICRRFALLGEIMPAPAKKALSKILR